VLTLVEWSEPAGKPLKASLVQGNIPQELKWIPQERQPTIDLYTSLTRRHWSSDIIIWPETALPAYYHQAEDFLAQLAREAHANKTSMLIGLPFLDFRNKERRYYNSAVVLDNGDIQFYHKYHLVPFGEYVPLKWLLGEFLGFLRIPMADFSHSNKHEPVVSMSGLKGAVSICYEDAFGEEVINGLPQANFLINISNDAWFGDSLAPHQHLQKAQVRALETARPMLRATNNGISAIIDHKGNILGASPQFKQDVLTVEFQPMEGSTPYVALGNYPVLVLSGMMLLLGWRLSRTAGELTE
jgi:apolipoprotein N-acyltransferase